jgi:MFS family permease
MDHLDAVAVKLVNGLDSLIRLSGAPRQWPPYATRTFAALAIMVVTVGLLSGQFSAEQVVASPKKGDSKKVKDARALRGKFRQFQVTYLTVYLITMLADWLQGTNMYTLYSGYDMPVGTLFLTGFTSSAVFGTFVGLYVDKYGRRFGCVLFCVLEIIINTLEHFANLPLLLLGRVLGGISTSLLFSAFESWMVTEHRKRKFPEEWLASTQGLASTGNGVVAVLAGVLAQLAADAFGDIGPFRLAIALTVICLAFVLAWPENYGTQDTKDDSTFTLAMRDIRTQPGVLLLGAIQALYEGAMFTFVFVWVPTVLKTAPASHLDIFDGSVVSPSPPPFGLIFAAFMLCITVSCEE